MAINTGLIDGVQVPGNRYIVYGKQRGFVATHRTKRAAYRSLVEDSRAKMKDGKPSDAQVYFWRKGWELVELSKATSTGADRVDEPEGEE